MHTKKGKSMNTKANKPIPKVGVASDGRTMHYSVGALVQNENNEYFLMDRKYEPYGFAGMAGHVDAGEYPLQALMREGREEMGVELHNVRPILAEEVPWNHCRNDGINRIEIHYWHLYSARVNVSDITVNEHEARRWGWFTKDEIRRGWYGRDGVVCALTLEPVWQHWFKKVGIIPA